MEFEEVIEGKIKVIQSISPEKLKNEIQDNNEIKIIDEKNNKENDKNISRHLEYSLHILMIKLNYIKNFEYNFNLLIEYHQLLKVDTDKDKIEELNNNYPFLKPFYEVIQEFLDFLKELLQFYSILDFDSFTYKKDITTSKFLNYYTQEEIKETGFIFSTFLIPINCSNKKISFSSEIKEKSLILQNKFFILLNKFFEVYPLPKSHKEIKEYYDVLITNILGVKIESKENSIPKIKKSRISCCKSKLNEEIDIEQTLKKVTPLMRLDISDTGDINLHVIKKLIFEFSRSYLKVEELIFATIEEQEIVNSDEIQLIRDLAKV